MKALFGVALVIGLLSIVTTLIVLGLAQMTGRFRSGSDAPSLSSHRAPQDVERIFGIAAIHSLRATAKAAVQRAAPPQHFVTTGRVLVLNADDPVSTLVSEFHASHPNAASTIAEVATMFLDLPSKDKDR